MDSHYPLSAKRLYALMGDKCSTSHRSLSSASSGGWKHSKPLAPISTSWCRCAWFQTSKMMQRRRMSTAVRNLSASHWSRYPFATSKRWHRSSRYCIRCIWANRDVQSEGGFSSLMVEGLIVSGRDLVRSSADAMWRQE